MGKLFIVSWFYHKPRAPGRGKGSLMPEMVLVELVELQHLPFGFQTSLLTPQLIGKHNDQRRQSFKLFFQLSFSLPPEGGV